MLTGLQASQSTHCRPSLWLALHDTSLFPMRTDQGYGTHLWEEVDTWMALWTALVDFWYWHLKLLSEQGHMSVRAHWQLVSRILVCLSMLLSWRIFEPSWNGHDCNEVSPDLLVRVLVELVKLYSSKPTGHSRENLWTHLFVLKHRQNPDDRDEVYSKWYEDQRYMDAYKTTRTLRGVDIEGAMMGFNIENLTARQALLEAKDKHTRRWQTKEGTYRLKEKLLPDVRDTDVEMADTSTGLWSPGHSGMGPYRVGWGCLWAAGSIPGVQLLRALRMSHCLTCFTFPLALAACFCLCFCCCVVCWVGFWFCVLFCVSSCFASAWGCFDLYPRVLDDR